VNRGLRTFVIQSLLEMPLSSRAFRAILGAAGMPVIFVTVTTVALLVLPAASVSVAVRVSVPSLKLERSSDVE
jgi:hypothetical protein